MTRVVTVLGVLGAVPERLGDALTAGWNQARAPVVATPRLRLYADGDLRSWEDERERGWFWGQALQPAGRRLDRSIVTRELGCAGVAVHGDGHVMAFTDVGGLTPLFFRRMGDAVLFSTRVEPLVRVASPPLHVDRQAWAEIILGGMVMSERTPFEEIRRLPRGGWLAADDVGPPRTGQDTAFLPDGDTRTGDHDTAAELVDRLQGALARVDGDHLLVPLSGGLDSRTLAALATDDGRPVHTVTASEQFGRDEEPTWAAAVADALGLSNERLAPTVDWWDAFCWMSEQQDHLTSKNHWFRPLLERLAALDGTVLDGLGGDVFIKEDLPSEAHDGSRPSFRNAIHERFTPPIHDRGLLELSLAAEFEHAVDTRIDAAFDAIPEHPSRAEVARYDLRTPTGVGLAPTVTARSRPLVYPFLVPEVLDLLLRVDPSSKDHGRWYAQVLERLGRGLAALPSTATSRPVRYRELRPDRTPAVLRALTEALTHPSVSACLGPRLRATIDAGTLVDARHLPDLGPIRGLALFSLWSQRYAAVLADPILRPEQPRPDAPSHPQPFRWIDTPEVPSMPDGRWLAAQASGPHGGLRLDQRGPGARSAFDAATLDLVAMAGWPRSWDDLDRALLVAREVLVPGGRIAYSLAFQDTPREVDLPALCEYLDTELDVLDANASARRLRLVARSRQPQQPRQQIRGVVTNAALRGLELRAVARDEGR